MALKKCPSCGMQFEKDVKFCTKCGKKLENAEGVIQDNSENSGNDVVQKSGSGTENETASVNREPKPKITSGRGRVLKLVGKTVTLGMADGTVSELPVADLGFKVKVDDEIDIFINNGNIVYSKVPKVSYKPKANYNRLVYLLLALIFGVTGVHNFYSGNITFGVIWVIIFIILLLLFILTGIGAIISIPAFIIMWVVAVLQGIFGLFRSSSDN